jgi:Putative phage metallopeptidase
MYALLDDLVAQHHEDLRDARIALAWAHSWKPDVDGRVTLGKCRRAGDLDRELAEFDFVILLRRAFWTHDQVTDAQRAALLDHELCHGGLRYDASGEPVVDERGRKVYRTRRHAIEEFTEVVERHGMWTASLEEFAAALRRGASEAFKPCPECRDMNGWVTLTDDGGVRRVKRCACWVRWATARAEVQAENLSGATA